MIVNERIVSYIHSLEKTNTPLLCEMERFAKETNVPIIRKEMESFLRTMIAIKQPERILELGCAIGYSAILMSEYMPEGCSITTIENYDKRIPIATEYIGRADRGNDINLIFGDAMEVIPSLKDSYDFVFMDAAKAQYINFLPIVLNVMKKGGILIADNVLQEGDLVESKFTVTRRNRTIHKRIREFLYEVKNTDELTTSVIPIGDGITLSVKR
ncbi:MAG: O-methyltransferase [Lachnospiraceae bacterium]|nr:O-methyltransferase [Lachnospiraceae bacterium]MDE6698054.1 O-methyltransferase [Lachnospiraceae bacterium]